jgi:formylglycine-generating enzyme required for sulfatase activity
MVLQVGLGVVLMAGAISIATAADQPSIDKDMVPIPKGEFTMGSNEHSDEARSVQGIHESHRSSNTGLLGRSSAQQG